MDFVQRRGIWDEELLCEVAQQPRRDRLTPRSLSGSLRNKLSESNTQHAAENTKAYEVTHGNTPAIIYGPDGPRNHGNFIAASYRRILANTAWRVRLSKAHSAKRQARRSGEREDLRPWRELDAATSSDALLMNIFCYPRVMNQRLRLLLGVDEEVSPIFGYKPGLQLQNGHRDRTESDMRLGQTLIEAKLTEGDFQHAPIRLLERYSNFSAIFEHDALRIRNNRVANYQLLRGVMIAEATQARYCVIVDRRRTDLLEQWFAVIRAVRSYELQTRLCVVTWQEISATLPTILRMFLADKYGIDGTM